MSDELIEVEGYTYVNSHGTTVHVRPYTRRPRPSSADARKPQGHAAQAAPGGPGGDAPAVGVSPEESALVRSGIFRDAASASDFVSRTHRDQSDIERTNIAETSGAYVLQRQSITTSSGIPGDDRGEWLYRHVDTAVVTKDGRDATPDVLANKRREASLDKRERDLDAAVRREASMRSAEAGTARSAARRELTERLVAEHEPERAEARRSGTEAAGAYEDAYASWRAEHAGDFGRRCADRRSWLERNRPAGIPYVERDVEGQMRREYAYEVWLGERGGRAEFDRLCERRRSWLASHRPSGLPYVERDVRERLMDKMSSDADAGLAHVGGSDYALLSSDGTVRVTTAPVDARIRGEVRREVDARLPERSFAERAADEARFREQAEAGHADERARIASERAEVASERRRMCDGLGIGDWWGVIGGATYDDLYAPSAKSPIGL